MAAIPQPYRVISAAASEDRAVGAEGHRLNVVGVARIGEPTYGGIATSHSRTVSSPLPLAKVLPSGLNATEAMWPVWPVIGGRSAVAGDISTPAPCHRRCR